MDVSSDAPEVQTITRLAVQEKNKSRASVFLDGAFAFGVHQELILKHELCKGRTLDLDEQKQLLQEDAAIRAKTAALDYIAYRPRTEKEVRGKLQEKAFEAPAIEAAVERLRELGYLDDADYAREYVRGRFANKGYGPLRIRRELEKRGVERRYIEDALDRLLTEAEVLEAAREHARKRWPRLEDEDDPRRRRQKLWRYLRRRGFSSDMIRRVIDEVER